VGAVGFGYDEARLLDMSVPSFRDLFNKIQDTKKENLRTNLWLQAVGTQGTKKSIEDMADSLATEPEKKQRIKSSVEALKKKGSM